MLPLWGDNWREVRDRIEGPAWASDPSGPWLALILWIVIILVWKKIVAHLD